MDDINLGAAIARERRAAQVTQGELAAHLGVTKAAVSKWELEQSMPDVALLPRIAAYFDLTLDELFDYRPQLVGDDLQDAYLRLLAQFDEDPEAAFANAEDLVRSHYSCWPALQQMGMLYAQRATLDPDRAEPLAARAAELFERVERHADDVELVRAARMMRASVMSVQGDLDGCIALFESLKPDRTAANIDLMLASMYQQRGDLDAGLKLFQESMGWCVMNAISCVSAQIPLYADDAEHLEAARFSVAAACVLTALSLYTILWMIAEARAVVLNPLLVDDVELVARWGMLVCERIPLDRIARVGSQDPAVPKRELLNLAAMGGQALWIELAEPLEVRGLTGKPRLVRAIKTTPDDAAAFKDALRPRS